MEGQGSIVLPAEGPDRDSLHSIFTRSPVAGWTGRNCPRRLRDGVGPAGRCDRVRFAAVGSAGCCPGCPAGIDRRRRQPEGGTPRQRALAAGDLEFDQWLARQPVYTPAQVRRIKTDLATRVGLMSSFELEYLLDTLEAKLTVLESPEAEEARSWLGRYLAVMADRKREEVLGEVPNILDMSSNELEAAVRRVEAKRNAVEQQHARTLETRDTTAALVEANRSRQEEERAAQASRPAAEVYSPYRAGGTDPPFSGTYESPTVVGVGPWGSFLLIPTTAF
jgi:hypothetical protein